MNNIAQATRNWLFKLLGSSFEIEKHGYSNQDDVYRIKTPGKAYYLKVAPALQAEHDNLLKLQSYASVPEVLGFGSVGGKDHLLLTEAPGKNLAELVGEWTDRAIVKEFARAVRAFHALPVGEILPESSKPGLVVLHGDMSMPNIICVRPGAASYIDVAQVTVGSPDADLADAIWSLQRNNLPVYSELFLREYGDVVVTEKLERALRFAYSKPQ